MDLLKKLQLIWEGNEAPFLVYGGVALTFSDVLKADSS